MENQVIVTLSSRDLRAIAREALKGRWKEGFIVCLVYYVLMTLPAEIIASIFPVTSPAQMVGALYSLLVSGPFTFGLSLYFMSAFRKREAGYGQIFAGFENFGKTFVLMLLMTLKIILWSLLLVIPGIIASFRYSQAFFILVDHPEYSASQCIEESKRMMNGNKAKLFWLSLSFIGWELLASIPVGIVESVHKANPVYDIPHNLLFMVLTFIAMIGIYILMPYIFQATVAMYEIMAGNLKELISEPAEPSAEAPEHTEAVETVEPAETSTAQAEPVVGPEIEPTPDTTVVEDVKVEWRKDD